MSKKIVLIFGLQGSGKTTLANELGNTMNGIVLTTEIIRSKLFEIEPSMNDTDFTEMELKVTYNAIELLLTKLIDCCDFIVIEGVFRSYNQRNKIKEICANKKIELLQFYLTCSENIAKKRLEERKKKKVIQPGGYQTYLRVKENYDYPKKNEIIIDNSNLSLHNTLIRVINELK